MNENGGKRTLGLRGARPGSVKQSFSHGRTKSVVVETKRKRVVVPGQSAKRPPGEQPASRTDRASAAAETTPTRKLSSEMERRLQAVRVARAREAEDAARRAQEEKARTEERERRRIEAQKREREERQRAELARQQAEEEERRKREAEAGERRPASTRVASQPGAATTAPPPERAPGGQTRRQAPEGEGRGARSRGRAGGRRSGKLTLNEALSGDNPRQKSLAAIRREQQRKRQKDRSALIEREKVVRAVQLPEAITVGELANRMAERVADVVKALIQNGIMATQNQTIDADTAELIIGEFGHTTVRVSDADVEDVIDTVADNPALLQPRPPAVTVMGHVDHGKTSLLDAIRRTKVASGEAGGITQHIGAYQVNTPSGTLITFLDTPGHAAFTAMRARGAQVTDIVVLVVAADESVMPQTVEAINHARAATVPIIVAINKIDRPEADPDRVRQELLRHGIIVEKLSGDIQDVEVSAVSGEGIDALLEAISLQAELLELKANPDRAAAGAVIEARLDVGRGSVATVMVQNGTLNTGDIFVVGEQWGKVRAMLDDKGTQIRSAGPSTPVEVLGLNGTPQAGDALNVVETESQAREISAYREQQARDKRTAAGASATLEQLLTKTRDAISRTELPVVIKTDVQGSAEAIVQAMEKIGNEEVQVRVLHSDVGAITESDVTLAHASGASIIGFNVRANASARSSAASKGIELRYYSVIYDVVDDVRAAASGLLSAEIRETIVGNAQIKEVFRVSGVGRVAGCLITEGVARRAAGVRLLRDNVVIHDGTLKTLKRFKDEVDEVQSGQECGMAFERYESIQPGDTIEIFERREIARTLDASG